ncbi:hypothetical protein M758_11G040600 [Ceratodon purpureus]|nr:hypothetical protein M758_11G040600 [Ceratodon purpureus]
MKAEVKDWGWSPLFADFILVPTPPCIGRPFLHTEEEFQILMEWMTEEGQRIGESNHPPHIARSMKLFARSEIGARTPMLCPVRGLTEERYLSRPDQIIFAMEELIRVGKIYFPTMSVDCADFEDFRVVVDKGNDRGGQVAKFTAWRRNTFVRACLDMVRLGQVQVLRDMWVAKDEVVDREAVTASFRKVLLLRENLDLEYCLGSLESTGFWPRGGDEFFKAAKNLLNESMHECRSSISAWNLTADLEDLDDFRASQVLCTFDVARFAAKEDSEAVQAVALEENADVEEGGHWGQVEDEDPAPLSCSPVVQFIGAP